jgi:glycosyltransferase involved in cell wall biosynthesis
VQGPEPEPDLPLISALMVTRGRPRQAQLAIQTFQAQTYQNRELVVVDDDSDPTLARWISTQADPHIRLVRLSDAQQTLGELRNLALEQAHGLYVCQWDDDDLHDPLRLEVQLQTLRVRGAQASLLARWMIWWPQHQRLALSCYRNWEGSLLCRRSLMPAYPCLRRGEDSQLLEQLSNSVRVARIDMPRLYLYVVHGTNTFEQEHFETHWHQATARWQGSELDRLLPELQRRMPIHVYRRILDGGSAGAGAEVVHHPCA